MALAALCLALPMACSSVPPLPESPSATALLRQAQTAQAQGQYREAGQWFDQAADAARMEGDEDQGIQARLEAGECYLAAGDSGAAWRALSEARAGLETRRRATWFPVAWMLVNAGLGDLDLKDGRLDNARVHYQEALEVAQADARDVILYRLAVTAERQGDADGAALLRARILRPESAEVLSLARALGTTAPLSPVAPTAPIPGSGARVPTIQYLNRTAWAARPSRANFDPMGMPYRITVHHTGEYFNSTSQRDASSMLQKIQRHHQDTNGWADIGYHFLIDPQGRIWQGRAANHQGAHAGSPVLNRGNVGIALLGNFSEQSVTSDQKAALVNLLTSLMTTLRIPVERVYSHQDVPGRTAATECPGSALQRAMPGILGQVRSRLAQAQRDGAARASSSLLAARPN